MDFKCTYLDSAIINDLLDLESQGAKGVIKRQVERFKNDYKNYLDQIEAAIKEHNFENLRHHTHKLNGFAGVIGAAKIREKSLLLEKKAIEKDDSDLLSLFSELREVINPSLTELDQVVGVAAKS